MMNIHRLLRVALLAPLCVFVTGIRAQKAVTCRYWFDGLQGTPDSVVTSQTAFRIEADASGLLAGLHTLFCQITNEEGEVSAARSMPFLKLDANAAGQFRVCVDGKEFHDYTLAEAGDGMYRLSLNAETLSGGLHYLMVSFTSGAGNPYSTAGSYFLRMPITTGGEAVQVFYTIDGDAEHTASTTVNDGLAHVTFDMASLANGLHTISFRYADKRGMVSSSVTDYFLKIPVCDEQRLYYALDGGEVHCGEVVGIGSTTVRLDTDALVEGLHTLTMWLSDNKGVCSNPTSAFFMKLPAQDATPGMKLFFSVDDGEESEADFTMTDGLVCTTLNMSALDDGEHTLTLRMVGLNGSATQSVTATFVKDSSGNGISTPLSGATEGKAYDLQGRPTEQRLPYRIYIVDGTKVLQRR